MQSFNLYKLTKNLKLVCLCLGPVNELHIADLQIYIFPRKGKIEKHYFSRLEKEEWSFIFENNSSLI